MNPYLNIIYPWSGRRSGIRQLILFIFLLAISCRSGDQKKVPAEAIGAMNLKRGEIVLCGPPDKEFGQIEFDISCSGIVKKDFNLAVALLHSFEYDEAEKVFAKVIDKEPGCAMAYWGVAMSNFHPVWAPSNRSELEKGLGAIKIARTLPGKSERESDYIEAIAQYYENWEHFDFHTRCVNFRNSMANLYKKYPSDKEAAVFYALALVAAADPGDNSFADQKKAGAILTALYPGEPNHPGIVHYLIHTYDYPQLAEMALPAARKYASIAPSSAHAQHMPSHIFTRLGLWDESINSNLTSTSSAKCYAENAGMKGHWDEELHGMDYLVYAYLQKGDDSSANRRWAYLDSIQEVFPVNFKDAYAFAAIPARCLLENRNWQKAANLQFHPASFPWDKFPWQKAIVHFTRLLGSAHAGNLAEAKTELGKLKVVYDTLMKQGEDYNAALVNVQVKAGSAWILFEEGKKKEALVLMDSAADLEEATRAGAVSPGEVAPAREMLGDMLMQMGDYKDALEAYQADLILHPNRLNGLLGAGLASEKCGMTNEARSYYRQISDQCIPNSKRTEVIMAREYFKKHRERRV